MISDKMQEMLKTSSMIRAMFEEGERLAKIYGRENVYDFSLGNPKAPTPEKVKKTLCEILNKEEANDLHGYMNNSGFESVRQAISENLNKKYATDLNFKHIIMTCGAAGAINVVFKTLLNPEQEIITFAPYFTEYDNYARNFDSKLTIISPNYKDFQPDLIGFERAINKNTKLVLINTPNNPTGVIYSEENIVKMCEILNKKSKEYGNDIYLISDEPYRELVYTDKKVPYILNYYDNAMVIYSFSKSLSLAGERIGYIAVNPKINNLDNLLIAMNIANRILGFVNAPALFQKLVARLLDEQVDIDFYKKNRDLLYEGLKEIGYEAIEPEGAFYLFLKSPIENEKKFCELAKKYNILMVPGSAFGARGYVRLSYCIEYERIKKSLGAFKALFEDIRFID